jgi:membrane fusion protein (multidrug efflux system)
MPISIDPEKTPGTQPSRPSAPRGLWWRSGRNRTWIVVGAVLLVAAIVVAWRYYSVRASTDDAQVSGHITPISARVGGVVETVNVGENQHVEAGSVLVQLDRRDYEVALRLAEGEYAASEAELEAARIGVPLTSTTTESRVVVAAASIPRAQAALEAGARETEAARARLAAARARLEEAAANDAKVRRDLERMKQLIAKDEISEQQYDAAVAAAKASGAAVTAAEAAVSEAEQGIAIAESRQSQAADGLTQARAELQSARTAPAQVKITEARVALAEAKVKESGARLDQARLNLEYTTIKAPVSGVIGRKNVEVGQNVQAGQPLMPLVPLEEIWITANFKETDLRRMRPGQPATISVDAYGRTYRGHVESISPATGARFSLLPPENATGNYVKVVQRVPVRIALNHGQDPEHLLRPGMSVVVTVVVK